MFLGCIIDEGTDYSGNDIPKKRKPTKDQQECADFSASTPGGLFWTWNKKNKMCYVKSANSKKNKAGIAVSGNRECGKETLTKDAAGKLLAAALVVLVVYETLSRNFFRY